jgi:RNA polymerase sigma-70 factor, ECF subfamily
VTADAFARAAAHWPGVQLTPAAFEAYVSRCLGAGAGEATDDALAELFVACACSAADPVALALFDAHYLAVVPAAVAHMQLPAALVDDVRQLVRQKLLVSEGEGPKLDRYAGRGRLRGLVQVMAVRTAITLLRKEKPHRDGPERLGDLLSPDADPELGFMKRAYRKAFATAFEDALAGLSSRDRNVLRLHHFGGLSVEQVGEIYGVHRATMTRWLARIRSDLLRRTREGLGGELGVDRAELESLMKLIESRLEVSVKRMLGDSATPSEPGAPPASDPGA